MEYVHMQIIIAFWRLDPTYHTLCKCGKSPVRLHRYVTGYQILNVGSDYMNMLYRGWCSEFYPGSLWYIYERTGNPVIKAMAAKHTATVTPQQYSTATHDVGFQINCSFGNGYRLTGSNRWSVPLKAGTSGYADYYFLEALLRYAKS